MEIFSVFSSIMAIVACRAGSATWVPFLLAAVCFLYK